MACGALVLVGFVLPIIAAHSAHAQDPQARLSFQLRQPLVQAEVGGTAKLSCVVNNLGSRQVEWRKYPETRIPELADDQRISVDVDTDVEDQTTVSNLTITGVTEEDAGYYQCVALDENGVHGSSYFARLLVGDIIEHAPVGIDGPHYAELNSPMLLTCLNPTGGTRVPDWFKDGDHVSASYDPHFEMQQFEAQENRGAASAIIIQNARMSDSGTYVCRGEREGRRVFIESLRVMVLRSAP